MNWHVVSGAAAGVIAILAVFPYIKDILKRKTRPNTVSWSIWTLLLLISIFAQWSAGPSWSIILLIGDLIGTTTIVVLCVAGYGYGRYGQLEWTCLALAILAIALWQTTKEPVLAISFAIVADALASLPTVVKAYRDPWSEHPTMWFLIALGAFFGILSTTIFDAPNLLFPAYIFLVNGTIGLLALTGRGLRRKN